MQLLDFEKSRKEVLAVLAGKVNTVIAIKVVEALKKATIEAEPVVRCKDCKFYNNHGMRDVVFDHDACHWNADEQPNPDDFCSCGERRADDAD